MNDPAEEIGLLLQERDDLNRRGSYWHSHKSGLLYVAGALAFMAVCSILFGSDELGPAGIALCAIGAIGAYRSRENEDARARERVRSIEKIVDGEGRKL
jgi:hypothetical protein